MTMENFEPKTEAPPPKEEGELSLVSLNAGSDLASLASRAMVGCDVLFNQQTAAQGLSKTLARGESPASATVGNQLADVLNGGLGTMEMRVSRLNDYTRGAQAKATYDQQSGRITLTNSRGESASYQTHEDPKSGETRVSPRPVAYRFSR